MPNKVPGKLGESYPSFLPTHATDAFQHIQQAVKYNQQAMGSQLDMQLVRQDKQYIDALAERFSKGAAALKGGKWKEQEAKYAHRMKEVAETAKVSGTDGQVAGSSACRGVPHMPEIVRFPSAMHAACGRWRCMPALALYKQHLPPLSCRRCKQGMCCPQ